MPSELHQDIVAFLYQQFLSFVQKHKLGKVLFAPLRVRLWQGKFREPDLVFMLAHHSQRRSNTYWDGADLVVEVVSPDNPERDKTQKRLEYAQAGIPEYWLVDPISQQITVFTLQGKAYIVHGTFAAREQASSVLLMGFVVDVSQVFAAAGQ